VSSEDTFTRHLRHALNHLYEPDVLRASPLGPLLLPPEQARQPMALSRALTEAIESLKPGPGTPPGAPAWRVYELLLYRYVHCATQADLAQQLAISVRQLRREQAQALALLAEHLVRRYGLTEARLAALDAAAPDAAEASGEEMGALRREYHWLQESTSEGLADLARELETVRGVAGPLLTRYRVRLEMSGGEALPPVAMPSVALRQALLSLLTAAVHRAAPGVVTLRLAQRGARLALELYARREAGFAPLAAEEDAASLRDAGALLRLSGGDLALSDEPGRPAMEAQLPLAEMVPVLVVDDNRDALQLLERYAAGTRYRVTSCHDPLQALEVAEREHPALVVVDVMMAGLDGWQFLQRLRQGPAAACRVIVCTVLAQREVAMALGADDFIRKPVSRQAFLEALDRQWAALGPGPAPGRGSLRAGPGSTARQGG